VSTVFEIQREVAYLGIAKEINSFRVVRLTSRKLFEELDITCLSWFNIFMGS
jgi:hypothetical protein